MTSRIVKVARDSKLEIAVDIWCGRKLIKSFLQWQYRLASSVATPVACQQVMSKKKQSGHRQKHLSRCIIPDLPQDIETENLSDIFKKKLCNSTTATQFSKNEARQTVMQRLASRQRTGSAALANEGRLTKQHVSRNSCHTSHVLPTFVGEFILCQCRSR